MLRAGLTGGIACGKSTVAAIMGELGCAILDADSLAHRLIEPGQPAYQHVLNEFGPRLRLPDGRIDRFRLGEIVFGDPGARERLNRIVHPRVLRELEVMFRELDRAGLASVAVVEAALLVEAKYHDRLDRLVVVWCRAEQQVERLLARGLSLEQARQRIAAQIPLDEKRRLAHDQIDCSGSLDQTRAQTGEVVARLMQLAQV